ncbi:MAG: biopolymer transporter ExbD [Gemmatimonadetes bacterium]|nr:biopolymer transporter ExbD [Gemmatimonadota bacterium]MDE2734856.1 biopolymer transporter ExbD [Gemmatimonadota bacterium]
MVQQRTSILEDLEDENLNLTPLIDCVFLLLIFFMVTTVFKQPYSLRVELPQARQATIVEEKKLVASIDKSGAMELNRQLVSMAKLPTVLAREKETTRSLTLIIRTDKKTRHGLVLEVMEIAKRLDVDKVVLATEEEKEI